MSIQLKEFTSTLEATLSQATATKKDTLKLIDDAKKYEFCAVIGPRCYVNFIAERLKNTRTIVGAGCCFPAGHDPQEVKAMYAKYLVDHGAQEIDMVMNIGYFKSKMYKAVQADILCVRNAIGPNVPLKCIIEVGLLTDAEIREVCHLLMDSEVDFIKTATGLNGSTNIHQVELIANTVKGKIKIKAAGGIRTVKTVEQMRSLGVSRFGIGLNSALNIIDEINKNK